MSKFSRPKGRPPRHRGKPASKFGGAKQGRRGQRVRSAGDGSADGVRLQKVLAAAGAGSRRQCEELITQGRVEVDGKTVTELGTRVDPFKQQIRLDGETLRPPKRQLYFLINKPEGVLSTNRDPAGRMRVIDLAPSHQRLFTVGRLDKTSSGLILATNDGELTDLLTHPRYGVEKTYVALVAGVPTPEAIAKLQRGVHLAEGYAHAKRVTVRRSHRHSTMLEIVLDEGRNREARRLLARVGHKVLSLRRVAMGPLRLGKMQPGESRPLTGDEVEELYRTARQRRRKDNQPERKPSGEVVAADAARPKKSDSGGVPAVRPIIDYSLPTDTAEDDDLVQTDSFADDNLGDSGAEVADDFASDAGEFADVDLSPINLGGRSKQQSGTVIGGDRDGNRDGGGRAKNRQHRGMLGGRGGKSRNRKRRRDHRGR